MESRLQDLLPRPVNPRVVYAHPPLVLALCQVRFPTVHAIASSEFVAPFQRAIQNLYPISTGITQDMQIQVAVGRQQAGFLHGGPMPSLRFSDPEDNWTVVLAPESVTLETRAYGNFDDFLQRLREVLQALIHAVTPAAVTRIGLRYVNELRPGHANWASVVRPELLGPFRVPEIAQAATQAAQAIVLEFPEGQVINVNHGFVPSGTTVQPRPGQSPPMEPFYVLDFDAYREFPRLGLPKMDPDLICGMAQEFHDAVSQLFRWSITEEFHAALEAHPDGA